MVSTCFTAAFIRSDQLNQLRKHVSMETAGFLITEIHQLRQKTSAEGLTAGCFYL